MAERLYSVRTWPSTMHGAERAALFEETVSDDLNNKA